MAEIYGKRTGLCHGKGGSMHIADLDAGNARRERHRRRRPAADLRRRPHGEGARAPTRSRSRSPATAAPTRARSWRRSTSRARGTCRACSWSRTTATPRPRRARSTRPGVDVAKRADGFGMPGIVVDGFDFFAVHEVAGEAIARARGGGGPTLIECKVGRYYGHFEGDQQTYRAPERGRGPAPRARLPRRVRAPHHRAPACSSERGPRARSTRRSAALIERPSPRPRPRRTRTRPTS